MEPHETGIAALRHTGTKPAGEGKTRHKYLNATKRSFYLKKVDALSQSWALKTYKTLLFSVQKKWMHTWGDCEYSVTKLKGYDGRKIKPLDCWGFEYNVCMLIVVIHQVLRWIKQIQKYVVFHSSGGIIHPQSLIPCSTIKPCISCMVALVSPHNMSYKTCPYVVWVFTETFLKSWDTRSDWSTDLGVNLYCKIAFSLSLASNTFVCQQTWWAVPGSALKP